MSGTTDVAYSYLSQPRYFRISWWTTSTAKEKNLTLLLAITSVLVAVFLITTIVVSTRTRNTSDVKESNEGICRTDECLNIVYQIRLYLDERNDPCDDFHAFACGNFPKIHKGYRDTMSVVYTQLYHEVIELLEASNWNSNAGGAIHEARSMYQQCMKQEHNNEEGLEIVKDILKDILQDDIPLAMGTKWEGKNFDWRQSVLKLLKGWGQNYFLPFQIFPSPTNSSRYIPYLMFGAKYPEYIFPKLPSSSLFRKSVCILYPESDLCGGDLFKLSGAPTAGNKTVYFTGEQEKADSWFVQSADTHNYSSFEEYEIKEIQSQVPQVDWQSFVEYLLGHPIDQTFKIATNLTYLNSTVRYMDGLDNRTAAYKIAWTFIEQWGILFSKQLREVIAPRKTQEYLCFSLLNQVMGFAVGKMYIDKYVPSETIEEVENITVVLEEAFTKLIQESKWMDEVTKITAYKKVGNMRSSVGVPRWTHSEQNVNEYYKEIQNVIFLPFDVSVRKAKHHYFKQQLERLNRPVDIENDWVVSSPITTNAAYYLLSNAMFYYLGMVKEPLFFPGGPRAVKFGRIGTIAGHEITHGFDLRGKSRDETGIKRNWWTQETTNTYDEKAQCFVECYSNITDKVTNLKLNGERTLNENIADSEGLRIAYQAFKSSPAEPKPRLKGLEYYTEEQLFFISAAQMWCSDENEYSLLETIWKELHSPSKYRAIVPFQNYPEFAKAFQCNDNSFMNPKTKCSLW